MYFEQPYYLVPDKDAAKAYRLLTQVMEDENKVAVGRFVLRSKEALVAIRPVDGMLCLETMRYADEVLEVDREQIDAEAEPSERELDMARQLVNTLAGEFDPEKYHDEYREEVLALIDKKAAGEEIVAPATPEEPAKVLDLMAALEASLARTGSKQPTPAKKPTAKKTPAKKPAAKKAAGEEDRHRGQAHPQIGLRADPARYDAWGIATRAGRRRGKRRVRADRDLGVGVLLLEPPAVAHGDVGTGPEARAGLEPDRVGPEHHGVEPGGVDPEQSHAHRGVLLGCRRSAPERITAV